MFADAQPVTPMTPDPTPEMRLIDVVVQSDQPGFVVATSRQLPKLLAVATSHEELANDLPELICRACAASFGEECRAFAVETHCSDEAPWRCERWVIVPT